MVTIDKQVAASGNDGVWNPSKRTFGSSGTTLDVSANSRIYARWTGITIPRYSIITAAYIAVYYASRDFTLSGTMYFDDQNDPSAVSSYSDGEGRTKTSASVTWNPPSSAGWNNSPSIVSIIQELVDSYDYSNEAMQFFWICSGSGFFSYRSYDYSGNTFGFKLHIEYTEASTDAEPLLVGGKLVGGGLLLNGLCGR